MARSFLLGRVRNTGRMEVKSLRRHWMEGFTRVDSHPTQSHALFDCPPCRGYNRRRFRHPIKIRRLEEEGMATSPPTQESFEKLLMSLHPDRERAGEKYELLRLKLVEYFQSRACLYAEELADETLNRLTKKVAEGEEIRDALRYCYGLARWVWVEHSRRPEVKQMSFDELPVTPFVLQDSLVRKEREACFQYCLRQLPARERELVVEYWDHEDRSHRDARKEMAERLQITLTALRIRVSRIKDELQACFSDCLERGAAKLK